MSVRENKREREIECERDLGGAGAAAWHCTQQATTTQREHLSMGAATSMCSICCTPLSMPTSLSMCVMGAARCCLYVGVCVCVFSSKKCIASPLLSQNAASSPALQNCSDPLHVCVVSKGECKRLCTVGQFHLLRAK